MGSIIDVTLGQKWRVYRPFKVRRSGVRYEVPVGSTLEVKTLPNGGDDLWVTHGYNRFPISRESIQAHAQPI
jgi:hypothetical protein